MTNYVTEQFIEECEEYILDEGIAGGILGFLAGNIGGSIAGGAIGAAVGGGTAAALGGNVGTAAGMLGAAGAAAGQIIGTIGGAVIGSRIEKYSKMKTAANISKCKSLSGPLKYKCLIKQYDETIKEIRKNATYCNKSKDPVECKARINEAINKYKEWKQEAQKKIYNV